MYCHVLGLGYIRFGCGTCCAVEKEVGMARVAQVECEDVELVQSQCSQLDKVYPPVDV
jgi:hypothetical protein